MEFESREIQQIDGGKAFRLTVLVCFVALSLGIALSLFCERTPDSPLGRGVCRAISGQMVDMPLLPTRWRIASTSRIELVTNSFLVLGIGLLILLPVFRMLLIARYFLFIRDRLYFVISAMIVSVTLFSFLALKW